MASEDLVREAQDPSTTAARLAELAQADRALWPAIAVHPAAYPGLLDWLDQQGDPTVSAVLALRSGSTASTSAPTEVISTEQPTTEQPAVEQPASPVAEPVIFAQQPEPTQTFQQPEPTQTFQPVQPAAYAAPAGAPLASDPAANGDDGSKKKFWLLGGMIAAVILLVGGAAFGAVQVFGDDEDDKQEATSSQTEDADETPEPTDAPTTDAPTTDAPTTDAPSPGAGGSGDDAAFCQQFKDAQDQTIDSMGGSSGGSADTDKLADSFRELAATYEGVQDVAPSQIKSDVGVMADYFKTFQNPSGIDPSEVSDRIKEFAAASKTVSQYYADSCI